jgi:tetratricopeptide (TPR) repeat protein
MDALTEAGVLYWMLGRKRPALRCLGGAIELGDSDSGRLAYCLIERGTLYRDVRDYESATADLNRALELARKARNKHLELRALGNLCTVQDTHMTQSGVLDLYEPVLKLAREIGDDRAIGITEGQIGLACMRGDDFAAAERHLTDSIEKLRTAGDKLNEGAMVSSLGTLFEKRTDGDRRLNLMRAVQYHRDGLAIKEQLGYLFQKAAPLCGLASSHRLMGMLPEAEKYARRALQLSLEIGDPANIGNSYFELGAAQEAAGDLVMAERTYSYGFLAVEESQAEAAKIKLLGALARLMAGQGDWEDAQNHAHNAVQLAARVKDTRTRSRTRQLLKSIENRQKPAEDNSIDFD